MKIRLTSAASQRELDIPSEVIDAMQIAGDVFEMAGATSLPGEDDDWDCIVEVERLRLSLSSLRKRAENNSADSLYVYETDFVDPKTNIRSRGGGRIGGIRIAGEIHRLKSGLDVCLLERLSIKPDGTGNVVAEIDLRGKAEIETDTYGVIKIRKKKAQSVVAKWVASTLRALKPMEGKVVVEFA
ncbi:MAG: hypothetical protein DHS20C16_24300 [Phycisphaerae bacterium]|nr:MAG: hypothetical protein DHS20C16_24300 [Phycisphaerae bacterium]